MPAPTEIPYDYRRYAVLYVDDEEMSLKYFARAFEDQFRILTASSAAEGLRVVESSGDSIGLIMTDQRMPGERGVWLLERVRQLRPRIVRILVTAFSDLDAVVAAVNTGAIYKYVNKPWDPPELQTTLKRGLEFFMVQNERDQLLREKLSVLRNIVIADRVVSLGLLAAGLSHHIRNALTAVKTFLDLAPLKLQEENVNLDTLRNPDFWRDYYRNVQTQIDRINSMLRELWIASESSPAPFQDRVHLPAIVVEAAGRLGPEFAARRLQLALDLPEDLPALTVDRPKFLRLFELFLKDEMVSLPPGSTVRVAARLEPDPADPLPLRLTITDDGPGLPAEALRLLFDPFAIRSDTPLEFGLNLMGCYFIVHHHGGRIEARNTSGTGTEFVIRLPLNAAQPPPGGEGDGFMHRVLLHDSLWERLLSRP